MDEAEMERAAALRKKRTFRKFLFRGVELEKRPSIAAVRHMGRLHVNFGTAHRRHKRANSRKQHKLKMHDALCGRGAGRGKDV